jgi:hypothetical protein
MLPTLEDGNTILLDLSMKRPTPPGIFVLYDCMGLMPFCCSSQLARF